MPVYPYARDKSGIFLPYAYGHIWEPDAPKRERIRFLIDSGAAKTALPWDVRPDRFEDANPKVLNLHGAAGQKLRGIELEMEIQIVGQPIVVTGSVCFVEGLTYGLLGQTPGFDQMGFAFRNEPTRPRFWSFAL